MGSPKPLLPHRGRSLIAAQCADANPLRPVWLAADGNRYPDTGSAEYLPDLLPDKQGALSAIAPALQQAAAQGFGGVYVMSCDTLLPPETLIAHLQAARHTEAWQNGVVLAECGTRSYPLLARWACALADDLSRDVAAGQRRVHGWLSAYPQHSAALPQAACALANFNTPEEFAAACAAAQHFFPSV